MAHQYFIWRIGLVQIVVIWCDKSSIDKPVDCEVDPWNWFHHISVQQISRDLLYNMNHHPSPIYSYSVTTTMTHMTVIIIRGVHWRPWLLVMYTGNLSRASLRCQMSHCFIVISQTEGGKHAWMGYFQESVPDCSLERNGHVLLADFIV